MATDLTVQCEALPQQTFGGGRQRSAELGSGSLPADQHRQRAAALAPAEPVTGRDAEYVGAVRLQVENVHTADN